MISVRCPICNQTMQGQSTKEWPFFPFCSHRCKLIDLGRWLGEQNSLPIDEQVDDPTDLGDPNHPP